METAAGVDHEHHGRKCRVINDSAECWQTSYFNPPPAAPTVRTPPPGPLPRGPVWSRCPAALTALAPVLEEETSAVRLCPATSRAPRPAWSRRAAGEEGEARHFLPTRPTTWPCWCWTAWRENVMDTAQVGHEACLFWCHMVQHGRQRSRNEMTFPPRERLLLSTGFTKRLTAVCYLFIAALHSWRCWWEEISWSPVFILKFVFSVFKSTEMWFW